MSMGDELELESLDLSVEFSASTKLSSLEPSEVFSFLLLDLSSFPTSERGL